MYIYCHFDSTCDLCSKQMFFGLKCIECKYSCHKDCEPHVPPSCCGVPPELMTEFKQTFNLDNSNHLPTASSPDIVDAGNGFFFSSAPRTYNKRPTVVQCETNPIINPTTRRSSSTLAILKNYFEELSLGAEQKKDHIIHVDETAEMPVPKTLSHKSAESISLSESIALSIDSVSDSTEDRQSEWGNCQLRISLNIDRSNFFCFCNFHIGINIDDIKMLDVIGRGRFGVVKRAHWHGGILKLI